MMKTRCIRNLVPLAFFLFQISFAAEPDALQPIRRWYLRVKDDVQSRLLVCDTIDLGRDEALLTGPPETAVSVRFYYYDPGIRSDMGDEDYPEGPALVIVNTTNRGRVSLEEYLFGKDRKLIFHSSESAGGNPERIYLKNGNVFYASSGPAERKPDKNESRRIIRNSKALTEAWSRLHEIGSGLKP